MRTRVRGSFERGGVSSLLACDWEGGDGKLERRWGEVKISRRCK